MATERQIQANRENAKLSTGPRTVEGKSRIALNPLKHGLTSRQIVLPFEKVADFETFASGLWKALAPVGAFEEFLVERIVSYAWRTRRCPRLEAAFHARAKQETTINELELEVQECEGASDEEFLLGRMGPENGKNYLEAIARHKAAIWELERQPLLNMTRVFEQYGPVANLERHERTLQRSMFQALHELQRLQAARAGKDVPPPAALDINIDVNPERGLVPDSEPMVPDRAQDKANS